LVLHELQTSPNASIKEISTGTRITKGDVRAIILDLKAEKLFNDTFSTKTGQLEHESIQEEPIGSEEIVQFCPNCGSPVAKESDKYCSYCGAEI
jgi:rubrerythrin